ncbi:CTP-transf-like domain-containing protein [Mycena indigotica]|uniref:CTP-transf-like domain-containing protein n=1 Tax=Mycena indigotica TaxID=2126181 RepID=A0A8H6S880_9AGAR|nr:CTP-transf-like domain-containing protein [Mycena indigotica]KAF7294815.1 CTP-transf-like domain-containing protein [Mycena indigotica]
MDSTLLYASIHETEIPVFLASPIAHAAQNTHKHLTIILVSPSFDLSWNSIQQLLTFVYVQATKVAQDRNRILMQIDVLLHIPNTAIPESVSSPDVVFRVEGDSVQLPPELSSFSQHTIPRGSHPIAPTPAEVATLSRFPVVALGGTFDHLHAGHKILLSMGAWLASEKLIVGVTDDALLVRKAHAEVLESLSARITSVRTFLNTFRPGLVYDIVPINDVYGPTGWDPNIQALVVSKETASGAASIASHRAEHGLPALETFTIDVISATETNISNDNPDYMKQAKMSSTYIREWIVNHKQ